MALRLATADDRAALYDICVRTANNGDDARPLYRNQELLGEIWAGPYLALQPDLAFVSEDDAGVFGYVLGAEDTREFEAACEQNWWPALRARYPDPPVDAELDADEALMRRIHHPQPTPDSVVADHPAHLHIDVLPRGQGHGVGRLLIGTLIDALRSRDVKGVHLGVAATNTRAIGFYAHLGFRPVDPQGDVAAGGWLGRRL